MRSLRFVHLAGDGSHLVLETADGGEQFVLAADDHVRHAVGSPRVVAAPSATAVAVATAPVAVTPSVAAAPVAAAPVAAAPVAPSPAAAEVAAPPREPVEVSPREIQTRVRAGESPAEVAASLGTTIERILRFAAPVVEERLRIADEARRARARRGTSDRGSEGHLFVFGEIVDERFTAHGVAPTEVGWDALRRDDGEWVVRAEWHRGGAAYNARWVFHRSSRTVTALDESAEDLLSDRPIRPVLPAEPPQTIALAPGVVAFPPMPDALTGPLPVVEDVFDQDAHDLDSPRALTREHGAHEHVVGRHFVSEPVEFVEPPLPLGIVDPTTRPAAASPGHRLSSVRNVGGGKHEESDDERAARVRVPSWDDILLGVRRKQD